MSKATKSWTPFRIRYTPPLANCMSSDSFFLLSWALRNSSAQKMSYTALVILHSQCRVDSVKVVYSRIPFARWVCMCICEYIYECVNILYVLYMCECTYGCKWIYVCALVPLCRWGVSARDGVNVRMCMRVYECAPARGCVSRRLYVRSLFSP